VLFNANGSGSADQRLARPRRLGCDIYPPVHEKYEAQSNLLHMNWVLVDDTKGNSPAQMVWVVDR
jgi:hypothetical protein